MVGLAAIADMQRDRIDSARLVYFGCVDRAKVAHAVSAAVVGLRPPLAISAALDAAISQDLAPDDTPDMRADTKVHLAKVLTRRVLGGLAARPPHEHDGPQRP